MYYIRIIYRHVHIGDSHNPFNDHCGNPHSAIQLVQDSIEFDDSRISAHF